MQAVLEAREDPQVWGIGKCDDGMQPTDRPKPWGKAPTYPKKVKLIILSPDKTAQVTQAKQITKIRTGSTVGKFVTVGLSIAVVAMAVKTGPLPAGLALLLGLLLERLLARIWPAKKSAEN